MGKYFENASLDDLWDRLVNSTKNLLNSKKTWILTERTDMGYLHIENNYLQVDGDPWRVYAEGESYNLYNDEPLLLSLLDTTKSYNVINDMWGETVAILKYGVDDWGPVTFEPILNDQGESVVYFNELYNKIETVDAISYDIYDENNTWVLSGSGSAEGNDYLYPLTVLSNGGYVVRITHSGSTGDESLGGRESILIIGGEKEGTLKWVHHRLLYLMGLTHEHLPTTPGDYMKGISVAANYHTNNNSMDIVTENTLERIVDRLEHSCHLSDDMVLTINGSFYESGFRLIDAVTEEDLAWTGANDKSVYDLKDYYHSFQNGRKYYAVGVLAFYDEEIGPDYWYYNIRSNEVVCSSTELFINMSEDTSYLVPGVDGTWYYYKFTPSKSATYDISSVDNGGDLDCFIYNNAEDCLNHSDNYLYGDGDRGGFNYSVYLNNGETIYMRVRQYQGIEETFSISLNSQDNSGESASGWKLTDLSDSASHYNMRIADGYLLVDGDPWAVFDNDDNFITFLYYDTPVDLTSLDTGKSYYVSFAAGGAKPDGAHARLVYEAEGGDIENWLIGTSRTDGVYLTTEPNNELPTPTHGVYYTLFVNGEEKVTTDCFHGNLDFYWSDGTVKRAEGIGWFFEFDPGTGAVTDSGTVSIRING